MGLQPPYPHIYSELVSGRVIPFLGAAVPLYARNPKETPWRSGTKPNEKIDFLPLANELSNHLADQVNLQKEERGELTKIAQYYEATLGSAPLRQKLLEIFTHEQSITPLHDFLAGIDKPLLIVTTNYDDMLERAFRAADREFDLVVHMTSENKVMWWPHDAQPHTISAKKLEVDLTKRTVIYKMHGAVDRRAGQSGEYVITEDDYVSFLARMTQKNVIPDIFAEPFQTRPFLFLGYGLFDWNLRVILKHVQDFRRNPKFKSWAIETLSKPVEKKLWEARGVDVYDGLKLSEFLEQLMAQGQPIPTNEGGASS